ncbi:hypothetical protein BASA81_002026 [Batrachochytrium salamandrivorans]|nr:hypothetical protein BASA81_002026 [Batrachochytrium salamandrivorans]
MTFLRTKLNPRPLKPRLPSQILTTTLSKVVHLFQEANLLTPDRTQMLLVVLALAAAAAEPITRLAVAPTSKEFHSHLLSTPLLLENLAGDSQDWNLQSLTERFAHVEFRHGSAPYPTVAKPLSPNGEENEVFQFGTLPATFALGERSDCLPIFGMRYGFADHMHASGEVACALLRGVHVPKFIRELAPLIPLGGLMVGRTNATTTKHQHYAAINMLLHGEKYWEIDGVDSFTQRAGEVAYRKRID